MSLRVVTLTAARRIAQQHQRRTITLVPKLGSEKEMQAQAIEQIRARVRYQKELTLAKDHGMEEEVSEMWRWIKLTFAVGFPICALSAGFSFFFDEHAHRQDGELPEYMKVRSKEFPWQCGDCDLFDSACWKKCRAEQN